MSKSRKARVKNSRIRHRKILAIGGRESSSGRNNRAMEIQTTMTVEGTAEQVAQALLSNELADARMEALGVTDYTHTVNGDQAVTDARVGADRLPDVARRFVKGGIHVTVTATRSGNTVTYEVDPHGLPGTVTLKETVSGDSPATVAVEGEVHIKIPLVGAKLEKQAAGYVDRVLRRDARMIEQAIA